MLPTAAHAQAEQQRVAVLEITGNSAPQDIMGQITDRLRQGALRAADRSSDNLTILTRESIVAVLSDMGIDASCIEGECEVETARNLRATYVISGGLSSIEGQFLLSAKLHDVQTGNLMTTDLLTTSSIIDMIQGAEELGYSLLSGVVGGGNSGGRALSVSGGSVGELSSIDRGKNLVVNTDTEERGMLVIRSEPNRAQVTVNPGGHTGQTDMQLELPPGDYVVVGTLGERYHPVRQEVTVVTDSSRTVNLPLNPAFGDLVITSTPAGADLFIDGVQVGRTPFTQTEILSGQHQIKLELDEHHPYESTVIVQDEKKTVESVTLDSSKGGVYITSSPTGAQVWIRGQKVGKTPYQTPSMDPGAYPVRVTLDLHIDDAMEIVVQEGFTAKFDAKLAPNYGSINIKSSPSGASIALSGVRQNEKTPHTFDRIPTGAVPITLTLDGYGEWSDMVTVNPSSTARVNGELSAMLGRIVITATYPDGTICADEGILSIDGEQLGSLPHMGRLLAKSHIVEVECRGMRATRNVTIEHNQRLELPLQVNMFSREDLSAAKFSRTSSLLIDAGGVKKMTALGSWLRLEIFRGALHGDIVRTYDVRVALESSTLEQVGVYERDIYAEGVGFEFGAAVGFTPSPWLDFSALFSVMSEAKEMTTGWASFDGNILQDSDVYEHDTTRSLSTVIEPRMRLYLIPVSWMKLYALSGITVRFSDAYTVPDLNVVDYPDRPSWTMVGWMVGGGLMFDPHDRLGIFLETPWVHWFHAGDSYSTQSGVLPPIMPGAVNQTGWILRGSLGLQFRL